MCIFTTFFSLFPFFPFAHFFFPSYKIPHKFPPYMGKIRCKFFTKTYNEIIRHPLRHHEQPFQVLNCAICGTYLLNLKRIFFFFFFLLISFGIHFNSFLFKCIFISNNSYSVHSYTWILSIQNEMWQPHSFCWKRDGTKKEKVFGEFSSFLSQRSILRSGYYVADDSHHSFPQG